MRLTPERGPGTLRQVSFPADPVVSSDPGGWSAGGPEAMERRGIERWLGLLLLLGIYLSLRGYRSLEGDQAYRLPLLIHRQDPSVFEADPFVRAFDAFNPHRGSIALLDFLARPLGLSAALFGVFVATFLGTGRAVARMGSSVWGDSRPGAGWVAVGLFLAARAGNIGTNHLFEPMVLDRLVALAMGWQAIADAIERASVDRWKSSVWIAMAAVVHPAVGLQLAMTLAASWVVWGILSSDKGPGIRGALVVVASLGAAVVPGLAINLWQRSTLQGELPDGLFWMLSVELQGPQHMLPHLWRMPQWLAWFSYAILAVFSFDRGAGRESTGARTRLASMMVVLGVGLLVAWYAIEVVHGLRATVFQPFRMSTVARGLALVLVAGRLVRLWNEGTLGRIRASALAAGFLGDWLLVVVTLAELSVSAALAIGGRKVLPAVVYAGMMGLAIHFLGHHDTEYGHRLLIVALIVGGLAARRWDGVPTATDPRRAARRWRVALAVAWAVPLAAILAGMIPLDHPSARLEMVQGLIERCRFSAVPRDDFERLALWCRQNTPPSARFIGPPGPKTFRLWSHRSLAFNRAGSPYHGAGLADWFARFQDHVGLRGSPEAFIQAYREHRHEVEARYEAMSDEARAGLAARQGAEYLVAGAPRKARLANEGPIELLHVEGRYAVYRVRSEAIVHRQP